jgi:hypothetical protein
MNDRFKFRFYDKTIQFMGDVIYFNVDEDCTLVRFSYANEDTPDDDTNLSRGVLMQSTGCYDAENNLVYEGDIIKSTFQDEETYDVVKWCDNGYFAISEGELGMDFLKDGKSVVVGNIYENEELAKEHNLI